MRLKQSEKDFCEELLHFKSLNACSDYLRIQLDLLFNMVSNHHCDLVCIQADADARIMLQMYFSRLLNFAHLLNGTGFHGVEGVLNVVIDPSVLFTEVRGLYESLCVFELVYVVPDTDEKKILMHQLFTIAGLHERQQMHISSEEGKKFLEEEKKELDWWTNELKTSCIYRQMGAACKQKVDNNMSNGKFRIYIGENNTVVKTEWDDARKYFGMDVPAFDDMYRFFSLHAHPSSIAIRQFEGAFQQQKPAFVDLAKTAVQFAVTITSIFIADYLKKYPAVKSEYDKLKPYEQMLIDAYNGITRGKDYAIFVDRDK